MDVVDCRFHASVADPGQFPRVGHPEIAFMGRSNVGKSSLLNRLLGVRGLARTSKTPGRTQAIQYFLVNGRVFFVDLPGYGYARVPETMRAHWKRLVESYLDRPEHLALAVHLVDARHEPTELDLMLAGWLRDRGVPHRVVLTKFDKLTARERSGNLSRAGRVLGFADGEAPLPVSATTGEGIPALWREIDAACASARHAPDGDARPERLDPGAPRTSGLRAGAGRR